MKHQVKIIRVTWDGYQERCYFYIFCAFYPTHEGMRQFTVPEPLVDSRRETGFCYRLKFYFCEH